MTLWSRLVGGFAPAAPQSQRWVVLDVESTGLDAHEDHLLAIAAVAVHFDAGAPRIVLDDSFEALLQYHGPSTDKDNILVHGIGVGAQRAGLPPVQALTAFEQWAGAAPLVAFHAAFDEAMIGRAMQTHLRRTLRNPWLDLAPVVAALHPTQRAQALDDWLDAFAIPCAVRHQAAADTLATAELLLRCWPAARANGSASWQGCLALQRAQRWLSRA
jgi:DNA polymerase-3 subunit epsilon